MASQCFCDCFYIWSLCDGDVSLFDPFALSTMMHMRQTGLKKRRPIHSQNLFPPPAICTYPTITALFSRKDRSGGVPIEKKAQIPPSLRGKTSDRTPQSVHPPPHCNPPSSLPKLSSRISPFLSFPPLQKRRRTLPFGLGQGDLLRRRPRSGRGRPVFRRGAGNSRRNVRFQLEPLEVGNHQLEHLLGIESEFPPLDAMPLLCRTVPLVETLPGLLGRERKALRPRFREILGHEANRTDAGGGGERSPVGFDDGW
mmetsp:Transcript_53116/g.158942  ORF Transcript_53116/g.158942 Transcript_53116/m.158942 type:complete len:255 (+) Transcript_53116:299-1063(+)